MNERYSNNVLRFPRTSAEAFRTADYAEAIEWTPPKRFRAVWWAVFALTVAMGAVVAVMGCLE